MSEIKSIDSIQYHLWTDALHARKLAKDTTTLLLSLTAAAALLQRRPVRR